MPACTRFSSSTCCGRTWAALIGWMNTQARVVYNRDCYEVLDELLCAPCDPRAGVGNISLFPCQSLCQRIFDACNNNPWINYGSFLFICLTWKIT